MRIEIDRFFDQARSLAGAFVSALQDEFFTKEIKPSPRREMDSDELELARLFSEFDGA